MSNNMFQCSGSPSVCLATFLVEAGAAASVQTLFQENPIARLLGQATRGCLAGTAAVLGCSSVRHCTVLGYRPRMKRARGEGYRSTVYLKGASHTRAANYYILPTLLHAFFSFLIGVAQIKCHLSEPGDKTVRRRNFGGKY